MATQEMGHRAVASAPWKRLPGAEEGAQLAEYAFLLALVAVVTIPALSLIGPKVAAYFQSFADALT
jgi:Flp pilus assembly pilin Flp